MPLNEIINAPYNIINISAYALIWLDSASSPLLVMSMERDGNSLDWRAAKFLDYTQISGEAFLSLRFSDIHFDTKNVKLKVYIWNKNHSTFNLRNVVVRIEKGNPYFYGLFEDF